MSYNLSETKKDLPAPDSKAPDYQLLQSALDESSRLIDDIVLKKYLHKLGNMEIIPIEPRLKKGNYIRIFKINEMVYQKDEYSTYKFASVFNAVQNLNCGIFVIADSNGKRTDFYMGVRSFDDRRTVKSIKDTLRNALYGQFPGVKTEDLMNTDAEDFLERIPDKNIATVSCVAQNKDKEFKNNDVFIQGLEKLVLAMQGQKYTAVVIAKSTPSEKLEELRSAYENIYTQLSPFANMQISYGTNTAINISDTLSHGTSSSVSHSVQSNYQEGENFSYGTSTNESVSHPDIAGALIKGLGVAAVNVAGVVAVPFTGGASLVAGGLISSAIGAIPNKSFTEGRGTNQNYSKNYNRGSGTSNGTMEGVNENAAHTEGKSAGYSDNVQLTRQNKTLIDTLEKINDHLKRIDDCESVGMWECAAYFLSDTQESAEMAAETYRALMKGEKSGIESSAINLWSYQQKKEITMLSEYIKNFVHPAFKYNSGSVIVPVSPSAYISGNELAIHMGLPRKSVCGFPVIEHADFGKEIVRYDFSGQERKLPLGKIFSMGKSTETPVSLSADSLTMHTFITGSTGSGKSNTVYELLSQLRSRYKIPFLVVEPAKGEYKNVFGQFNRIAVYGTNPRKSNMLRINPFRFPADIHVLEHLDRLVEIFNVCWPMYAAMPAILKNGMERAYISVGWDLRNSENPKGNIYPNFADLLKQIENVINESKYSADSKGDYAGALLTRINSLTNGLNSLIFCNNDLSDRELFDESAIVDLSRVGSLETKSLIMGILVMKLNEYRMASGKVNASLNHITVLEEAHNLLKRTSTEQSSESSNLLGKSVELLANSIAEMRTYGEGFVIADQSPGLLDMSVIRNTNTKIILRLPDKSDRELAGYAAGLTDEQIDELSKLKKGVAAVYQNDWVEPVLVQVNKCDIEEKEYSFTVKDEPILTLMRTELMNFLLCGRLREKPNFSIEKIESNLSSLGLATGQHEFVENAVKEYKDFGMLSLWRNENFGELSNATVEILNLGEKTENIISTASDNERLTRALEATVYQVLPDASDDMVITLSQCMMKYMSLKDTESEIRHEIYNQWLKTAYKKGGIA